MTYRAIFKVKQEVKQKGYFSDILKKSNSFDKTVKQQNQTVKHFFSQGNCYVRQHTF